MVVAVVFAACVGAQAQTMSKGRSTGASGNVHLPMARVVVVGGVNKAGINGHGSQGLRGVSVCTPMIQQQMLARQYYVHGGVKLNGQSGAGVSGASSSGRRAATGR